MSDPSPKQPAHRDARPYIYGGLCLALAALYSLVFSRLVPSNQASTQAIAWVSIGVLALTGIALIARRRWSWWAGVVGCGYMLVVTVIVLVLIVHSAAFLAGVYGAFGRGAASMAYLSAAVVVQAAGLVPTLLMKFLMTRGGRRAFGLPPLGRAR